MRALVVIGSENGERVFGLTSGHRVVEALKRKGWMVTVEDTAEHGRILDALRIQDRFDVVVPVGFGSGIEDGTIYMIARMFGIPCAGPDPGTGSVTINKNLFAKIVTGVYGPGTGVRVPDGVLILRRHDCLEAGERIGKLRPPLIIKPNFGGSSLDLKVVNSSAEGVDAAVCLASREGQVLVQEMIAPAREVSVTILDSVEGARVLPIVELRRDLVMGYEEKFGDDARDRHLVPAALDLNLKRKLECVCLNLHEAIGACGLTRYDLLLTDQIVVLEANAIPGLLPTSIASDAARAGGFEFDELAELYAMSAFLQRSMPKPFIDSPTEVHSGDGV